MIPQHHANPAVNGAQALQSLSAAQRRSTGWSAVRQVTSPPSAAPASITSGPATSSAAPASTAPASPATHVPLTQLVALPQTRPQVPQFVPSVRVSTHAAPQRTRPVPQLVSVTTASGISITSSAATASSVPPSGASHWQAP